MYGILENTLEDEGETTFKILTSFVVGTLGVVVVIDVGLTLGVVVVIDVGLTLGVVVGINVGLTLGVVVGINLGLTLGVVVGTDVGLTLGVVVGIDVGLTLGVVVDGVTVGDEDGVILENTLGYEDETFPFFSNTLT